MDDVNPLIITTGTNNQNEEATQPVIRVLEETASEHQLEWDPSKDTRVNFGANGQCVTLVLNINHRLDWREHIGLRTDKADKISKTMWRLSNTQVGTSPTVARSHYTGMVRSLFTWGAEVWHRPNTTK